MNRSLRRALVSIVAFAIVGVVSQRQTVGAADLEVQIFDVGQADAILVTCPHGDHHLLIDSADTRDPGSSAAFREHITNYFASRDKQIDVVVASHPHADHIGSMQWVLENYDVETYIDNGDKAETAMFGKLLKLRRKLVRDGELIYINGKEQSLEEIDFCPDVTMRLLTPWRHDGDLSDPNDRSVGVWLQYKKKRFLFVGDMEDKAEEVLLEHLDDSQRKLLLDVDVLKVGHHGSDTSSTVCFVQAVSPQFAVISCGEKDVGTNHGYKHPRASTIDTYNTTAFPNAESNGRIWVYDKEQEEWRQKARHKGLWVTPRDGSVKIVTDGETVKVSADGR